MSDLSFKGIIKTVTNKNIITVATTLTTGSLNDYWIQIKSDGKKFIRKILTSTIADKIMTIKFADLDIEPKKDDAFIIIKTHAAKTISGKIAGVPTTKSMVLDDTALSKTDNEYKGMFIKIGDNVRLITEFKKDTKTITLDYDLPNAPEKNQTFEIINDFVEEYRILGIDMSSLSSIIDTLGGVMNFQISSIVSCISCILMIVIAVMMKKGGGTGAGGTGGYAQGGTASPVFNMSFPMQTQPYPFSSPFPRNT
jgi:hypothetical protein